MFPKTSLVITLQVSSHLHRTGSPVSKRSVTNTVTSLMVNIHQGYWTCTFIFVLTWFYYFPKQYIFNLLLNQKWTTAVSQQRTSSISVCVAAEWKCIDLLIQMCQEKPSEQEVMSNLMLCSETDWWHQTSQDRTHIRRRGSHQRPCDWWTTIWDSFYNFYTWTSRSPAAGVSTLVCVGVSAGGMLFFF